MNFIKYVLILTFLLLVCGGQALDVSIGTSNGRDSSSQSMSFDLAPDASLKATSVGGYTVLDMKTEKLGNVELTSDGAGISTLATSAHMEAYNGSVAANVDLAGYEFGLTADDGTRLECAPLLVNEYWGPYGEIPGYVPTSADFAMMAMSYDDSGKRYDWVNNRNSILIENDDDLAKTGLTESQVMYATIAAQEQLDAYTVGNTYINGASIRTKITDGVKQEIPSVLGDYRNSMEFEPMGQNVLGMTVMGYRSANPNLYTDYHTWYNSDLPWSTTQQAGKYHFGSVVGHENGHVLGLDHMGDDANEWYVAAMPISYIGMMRTGLDPGTVATPNQGERMFLRANY